MNEHLFTERGIYYRTNTWIDGRPTVVLMHGLSGSSSAWIPHETLFVATHNILTFDLRGHGTSKKYRNEKDYTIPRFAEDLLALIEHLKIRHFILVTHSFGVLIALEFLLHHQDRVTAAVLMSPSFCVANTRAARIVRPLFRLTPLLRMFPFNDRPHGHVDYTRHRHARDWNIPMTYEDVRNTGLRVYLYASKQTFAVNYENSLGAITIPLLLIHGKQDSIFPVTNTTTMAQKIPHASVILLDDADHIIVVNHFDIIAPLLRDFITRVGA